MNSSVIFDEKNNEQLTNAITNGGFGNVIEAWSPAQLFVFVDS
jgi:hypothetical protein